MRVKVQDDPTLFDWRRHAPAGQELLAVIGVPLELGNPIAKGAALAPTELRRRSLASNALPVANIGVDQGDLDFPDRLDLSQALQHLERAADQCYSAGNCPMILGGDHSISFSVIKSATKVQDIQVIWLDAHTDFSEWDGEDAHDHKQVLRRVSGLRGVRAITQIGYRGFTVGNESNLGSNARVFTSFDLADMTCTALLDEISDDWPCYISIDIDVIDPWLAPGTGAPVPGGITPEKIMEILSVLLGGRRVIGIDLVEVNPLLDIHGATTRIATEILESIARDWVGRRESLEALGKK